MPTLITLSNGQDVFTPNDLEAVLLAISGHRPLTDSTYTIPPGFIMIKDEDAEHCVNVSQIARVREVASRPNLR